MNRSARGFSLSSTNLWRRGLGEEAPPSRFRRTGMRSDEIIKKLACL